MMWTQIRQDRIILLSHLRIMAYKRSRPYDNRRYGART